MMPRSMVLVFLLLMLVITSQFEWKHVDDHEANPRISDKQHNTSQREEVIKEKIILSQEKNIQKLNELVRALRDQLHQCKGSKGMTNGTSVLI